MWEKPWSIDWNLLYPSLRKQVIPNLLDKELYIIRPRRNSADRTMVEEYKKENKVDVTYIPKVIEKLSKLIIRQLAMQKKNTKIYRDEEIEDFTKADKINNILRH